MELRTHQIEVIDKTRDAIRRGFKKPLIFAPCSFGKTIVAAEIARLAVEKGNKVLFLLHRRLLAIQTKEKFDAYGLHSSIIMAGELTDFTAPVMITTIQTYSRRIQLDQPGINQFFHDAEIIFCDECFTGDTLVSTPMGEKRIDIVRCGDIVYNQLGVGVVEAVSSTVAKTDLYLLELENGKTIKCTENHPFFTRDGWKKVRELGEGENLFSIKGMSLLWESVSSEDKGSDFSKDEPTDQEDGIRVCLEKAKVLLDILLKEDGKPYERQSGPPENEGYTKEDKTSSVEKRGKRAVAAFAAACTFARNGGGVGVGVCSPDEDKKREWLSDLLQDRHCESGENDRRRGGRAHPRNDKKEGGGCEENRVSCFPRVVNISRIQRKGVTPVFNLQVSGHPSYFANGIAVHNCHLGISETYKKIYSFYTDRVVIGLTGSPARGDQRGLGEVFNKIVSSVGIKQLTDEGFLAPVRYFAGEAPDLAGVGMVGGDWNQKQLQEKTNKKKLVGDVVENWLRVAGNRRTIVFSTGVKHSINLKEQFEKNGIPAAHLDSRSPHEERMNVLDRFRRGDLTVVTNCQLFTEGYDADFVGCIVIARSTKSLPLWIQMAGRGQRIFDGKQDCILMDFGGNIKEHGFLTDEIEWALDGKNKAWSKKNKKKEKLPVRCQVCHMVFEGTDTCPDCGSKVQSYGRSIEAIEAELKELEAKDRPATTAEKRRWYGMFMSEMQRLKKTDKWLLAQYKSRFKCWPRKMDNVAPIEPTQEVKNWLTYQRIKWVKSKKAA